MLPINTSSYDYNFMKTLNEDVQLKSNQFGKFDIQIQNGDYVNVTGNRSLLNACIIAIMTRYGELQNSTYNEFGCHAHSVTKENQTQFTRYKLELYLSETLERMRRIKTVDSINIKSNQDSGYDVDFTVTSINDETIQGSVTI